MINLKHNFKFQVPLILFILILLCNSCNNDDGLCADEDFGQLFLLSELNNVGPYDEDLLFYFKDSLDNEVVFKFLVKNVGHGTEQESSTNVPCEYDTSKRKEYNAKTEQYYFSLTEQQESIGLSFYFELGVRLEYLNGIMISDMLEIIVLPTKIPSGTNYFASISSCSLIASPRECSEEYLSNFPKPVQELSLLGKIFKDVYLNLDSTLYYNYDYGIIAFRDDNQKLWVLDRLEQSN